MSDRDDELAYGTAPPDAPITRADFERAIRSLNMSDLYLRDGMLNIAARVIALTDELTRRLDGVEPLPAEPNTPAQPANATVEAAVEGALDATLSTFHANDAATPTRISLDLGGPSTTPNHHQSHAGSSYRCAGRGAARCRSRCRLKISTKA
jgi:hypothetical protein